MGLSERCRRLRYVWSWRIRYWWFDTRSGEYAQRGLRWVAVLLALAAPAASPDGLNQALVWWVWAIIVIAAAAAASYAAMPKQKPPAPQEGEAPTVEDGKAVIHHFGECWIENEFILAWKQMGTEAIKSKGGKK